MEPGRDFWARSVDVGSRPGSVLPDPLSVREAGPVHPGRALSARPDLLSCLLGAPSRRLLFRDRPGSAVCSVVRAGSTRLKSFPRCFLQMLFARHIVKSKPIKSNLKFKKLSKTRKLQWRGPVRVGREHVGATPGAISRRFEPGSCPGSSEGGGGCCRQEARAGAGGAAGGGGEGGGALAEI